MNACDYLLENGKASAAALLTLQGDASYAEVRASAYALAAWLLAAGSRKGDRVVLLADPGLFWVAAYLGVLRAGLVAVPVPPRTSAAELQYIVAMSGARFALAAAKYAALHAEQLRFTVVLSGIPASSLTPNGKGVSLPETQVNDLAALMFTSGSTGQPRGVMVSHGNIIANTESIIECLSLTNRDRIMAVLPFHYCFGTSLLHTHLRAGGSVVIDQRFLYPEKVLQRMQETACTGFAGVPSHFQILLRKSNLARMDLPHLRYVQQAGGQLAPAFIKELRQALPGKQVFIMYGQTEATARLSCLPPELVEQKMGSIGKGIPGVTLSVLDSVGLPVGSGHTGEIVAEGRNVTLGYWDAPEETEKCFRDGKLYTGDLATVDAEGFIYIVGRAKDFLKCGGTRVSCRQLENLLLEQGDLLEASVVGVPDDVLGEAAVAYVVPRDPDHHPSPEHLRNDCRERLPLPLLPRQFFVLKALPKNSSGKVLKAGLPHAWVAEVVGR